MGTIIDYIKEYGDYTFAEKGFNDVDSLALCQLSYLKFDGLVPGRGEEWQEPADFEKLRNHPDRFGMFADERYRSENTMLYEHMRDSRRFGGLKISNYVNLIELEKETQFSAVTFSLDKGITYLAFRGTDETFVGWKEDFNLAFSEPVPGQIRSTEYVNWVASQVDGAFYIGGHSKGGNFAVYAAMNCKPEVQDRILKIYSHDGPGLRPEIRERCHYEAIAGRVVKVIPHSSLVGLILEPPGEDYVVVESKTFGLLQHNPFTWLVRDGAFVQVKNIYRSSRFCDETLNQWILSLDEEHIRSLVDTIYDVVNAAQASTVMEFTSNRRASMTAMIAALKGLDETTTANIRKIISSLFEIAGERLREEITVGNHEEQRARQRKKSLSREKHTRQTQLMVGLHKERK